MEYNKTEVAAIETTAAQRAETDIRELDELDLVLIGGGAAEPTFA